MTEKAHGDIVSGVRRKRSTASNLIRVAETESVRRPIWFHRAEIFQLCFYYLTTGQRARTMIVAAGCCRIVCFALTGKPLELLLAVAARSNVFGHLKSARKI